MFKKKIGIFRYCLFIIITIIALQPDLVCAQQRTISGWVKNNNNESLPSASVSLVDEKGTIINYSITNTKGEYFQTIPSTKLASPLWLEATYIGYKTQRVAISADKLVYNFSLEIEPYMLAEIQIKNKPQLSVLGDTIRYNVTSFSKKEDRTIGDVLRRMPGIEIANDGTIYFNGKAIENLYIHGDNLMDGRYGDLPKIVRKDMIESVDVIRNFQPIKVLQDKVLSDKTALNLVLKDENNLKVSVKTMVAAGLPGLYDLAFAPILLSKNIIMVNSLMANNAGVDYSNSLSQLGATNLLDNISSELPVVNLSLATAGPPDLPKSTYFLNKSALANFNNLFKTNKGLQFRVNIQGFVDNNNLEYANNSEYYSKNDTVRYNELQHLYNKPHILNTAVNFMINKERYYFNDNLKVNVANIADNSLMNFNSGQFPESLVKTVNELSNDLTWIPLLKGKSVGTFRWMAKYNNNEQNFNIGNGFYSSISGHQGYYDTVLQRVQTPSFLSNALFAYTIPGKTINQEYKLGYITEFQTLNSALSFKNNGLSEIYSGDYGNALSWNKNKLYFENEYQIHLGKLKSTIQLPVFYQSIKYSQQEYNLNTVSRKIIFTPLLNVNYDITPEQNVRLNYNYSNPFGNMTNVYRGAILMNYRNMQANNADLQEQKIHSLSIEYDFRKSISMFFLNTGLHYNKIIASTILSTEINDNISTTILLPYNNNQESIMLNGGISKYLFNFKGKISVQTNINSNKYGQFVNNDLLSFQSKGFALQASIIKKIFQAVNIDYKSSASWNYSKLNDNIDNASQLNYRTYGFEQNFTIGTTLFKKFLFELNTKQSYYSISDNNAVKYIFLDSKVRYTNKKKSIDLSLDITNLCNVKQYTIFSNSYNQLSTSLYNLRGRMAILRMEYYF
jgi:hypothetical protein